jgi:hypothetical protein
MKCNAVGCVKGKVTLFSSIVDCDVCGGSGWGKGKPYEVGRNEVFASLYGVPDPSVGLPNRIKIDRDLIIKK